MYALIIDGAVATYPYTHAMLRKAHPQTSFPRNPGDWMAEWGVYPVAPVSKPAYDLNFDIVEGTPVLVNGAWTQVWNQVPASAETIAARQQAAADETARAEVKADTFVKNFVSMTPAQVANYVANNTANLADVRALLTKMATMQLILAKRQLRD